MPTLPKIKIGRNSDRNYFDLSHDVNTTADFGFCQPTLVQELIPKSHFSLQTREFIRLAPLPVPTFGRVEVKTTTRCIPIKSVFPDFDHFISQRKISPSSSLSGQLIDEVDFLSFGHILSTLQLIQYDKFFSVFHNFTGDYSEIENLDPNDCFFRLSLWTNGPLTDGDLEGQVGDFGAQLYNVFGDPRNATGMANTAYNLLGTIFATSLNSVELFGEFSGKNYNYPTSHDAILNGNGHTLYTALMQFLSLGSVSNSVSSHEVVDSHLGPYSQYQFTRQDGSNLPANLVPIFRKPMTLDNADFVLDYKLPDEQSYSMVKQDGTTETKTFSGYKIGIHLTPAGKRIFKILFALGIDSSTQSFKLPMYKLFAYYKAWFDTYNVGRLRSWELTPCYRLIDAFHEDFKPIELCYDPMTVHVNRLTSLSDFFADLARCTYVLPADQYTCCTEDALYQNGEEKNISDSYLWSGHASNTDSISHIVNAVSHQYGTVNTVSRNALDALSIKALMRFYPFFNKFSVLGNKVNEIMKSRYGIDLPPTDFVSQDSFAAAISDIYNMSETEQGYLGEYAGKGVGTNHSDKNPAKTTKYDVEEYSILIQFVCVVPLGGYSQGCYDHAITPNEFYHQEYDALGPEYVSVQEILARSFNTKFNRTGKVLFGFRPRYTKLKYHDNLANGGFAFRGDSRQFLPYMLDRHFTAPDCVSYFDQSKHWYYVRDNDAVTLKPVEELRYIGLNEAYGNYDRIFVDNTGSTDNFILTIYQKFDYYAPMKSISESYDTFDRETDDAVTKVEKS